jgi:predicted DNA binding CopG/RHH family protein|tara:strand:+ start:513 stop:845 length:333 start_codon:yes stop_codon:yes gene_type:complete
MNMKIESTIENWENGTLGNDEAFVEIATDITSKEVDDMLALQMISIRLQKSLIQDLKDLATRNGLGGYQPLIRRVLERFVEAEMKMIARESMSQQVEVEVEHDERLVSGC